MLHESAPLSKPRLALSPNTACQFLRQASRDGFFGCATFAGSDKIGVVLITSRIFYDDAFIVW
ncbi:MAG: hypothetical protein P8J79_01730 [Halioglobus sp.]|nr:hypothetical protein [Halioglobus sp.]